jgi:putative ABC transport system ATP-binding protein
MLELRNLRKSYEVGTAHSVAAVADVTVSLRQGEFAIIVGTNGAGKSTLLRLVSGELMPDSGAILLDGRDVTRVPEYARARYVAHVHQDANAGTASTMSVEEHLSMALLRGKTRGLRWGTSPKTRRIIAAQLEALGMGLEGRLHTPVGNLSGGQRQAVVLLMATICPPKVILLDEHTSGLDPQSAASVLKLTDSIIQGRSLTALMVTHNMHTALAIGDRLIMMHRGRVLLDVRDSEKRSLSVGDLVKRFETVTHEQLEDDEILLGRE